MEPRVIGLLTRHPDGELSGWCWSPDRPAERLTVEILADETLVASFVADEMSYELQRQGSGDGQHTFRNKRCPLPPLARLLTARERDTGAVFGRVRLADPTPADPRALRIRADLERLRMRLASVPPAYPAGRQFGRGFGSVGARLQQRDRDGMAASRAAISRTLAGVTIPLHSKPECSVVLIVRDARAAASTIRALRPGLSGWLGAMPAELLIANVGTDPAASLLAGCVPAATYVSGRGGLTLSDTLAFALAFALDAARSRRIVLIDEDVRTPSAATLVDVLESDAALVIGEGVAALAKRTKIADVLSARAQRACGPLRLLVAADGVMLRRIGGFDPAFDGAPDAAVLDFCLKAALLGERTLAIADGSAQAMPLNDPESVALLAARWARAGVIADE